MTLQEIKSFADEVAHYFGWPCRPFIEIVTHARGRAYVGQGRITIPAWLSTAHPAMQRQYVIHEMCHFRHTPEGWTCRPHGAEMREVETRTSAHFGLAIRYRDEAYLSEIRDVRTGALICDGRGRTPDGQYKPQSRKIPHYA